MMEQIHTLSETQPRALQLTEMGRVRLIMCLNRLFSSLSHRAALIYFRLILNVIMLRLPPLTPLPLRKTETLPETLREERKSWFAWVRVGVKAEWVIMKVLKMIKSRSGGTNCQSQWSWAQFGGLTGKLLGCSSQLNLRLLFHSHTLYHGFFRWFLF